MAHYSKINYSGDPTTTYWNNIKLSPKTVEERSKLKHGIDNFATFRWREVDAFGVFGAFIINNKGGSLKFYNGPSFSNEYTKPQFETAAGQLTGVTFQVQKISFNIGVYWISEEDYRKLIYWLHPYEINTLTFGFDTEYYYQVKLASVEDGIRYVVGKEPDYTYMDDQQEHTIKGGSRYYTEIKLTFEVQGPAVAYGNTYFAFATEAVGNTQGVSSDKQRLTFYSHIMDLEKRISNLETPLQIETAIDLRNIKVQAGVTPQEYHLLYSAYVTYDDTNEIQKLFEVELKNLPFGSTFDEQTNMINITYNSETALLFVQKGENQEILTRLTTLSSGDRLVDHMFVGQFRIPGSFNDWEFDVKKMKINYTLTLIPVGATQGQSNYLLFSTNGTLSSEDSYSDFVPQVLVLSRPRTNLI